MKALIPKSILFGRYYKSTLIKRNEMVHRHATFEAATPDVLHIRQKAIHPYKASKDNKGVFCTKCRLRIQRLKPCR